MHSCLTPLSIGNHSVSPYSVLTVGGILYTIQATPQVNQVHDLCKSAWKKQTYLQFLHFYNKSVLY